jgi:uncharacterized protein
VTFHGHPNVLSSHKKSIEITRDCDLSRRGDCIIGVRSNKGCSHLDDQLRHAISRDDAKISIEIIVGHLSLKILGQGSRNLSVRDNRDIVIRKSRDQRITRNYSGIECKRSTQGSFLYFVILER